MAALCMSDARLQSLDMTFYEYINPQEQATVNFVDELVGPLYGMEARKATLRVVIRGLNISYWALGIATGFRPPAKIYVTNQPYNDAIFTPWVNYLRRNGVRVHTNTPIRDIEYDGTSIKSITTASGVRVEADDFILAVDQTALPKIIPRQSPLARVPDIAKACEIYKYGNNLWFGFMLYFAEAFAIPVLYGTASEQPWKPIVQNYNEVWTAKAKQNCAPAGMAFQVSVLNLVPGTNGKILADCSVAEAVKETLLQLRQSDLLSESLRTASGKPVWDVYDGVEVWPYWQTGRDGKLYNTIGEYKLSINRGVWERMPRTRSSVSNLFFGSVIVRGDMPMINMEMACTAGRNAAGAILTKYRMTSPKVFSHSTSVLLAPIRALDAAIFKAPYLLLLGILLIYLWWNAKKTQ